MLNWKFRFDYEPDTGWKMTLRGTVEAPTLEDAWIEVYRALGDPLSMFTAEACNDGGAWTIQLQDVDGDYQTVRQCDTCEGVGYECEACGGSGSIPVTPSNSTISTAV